MKQHKLTLIIPDRSNYIERYETIDFIYALYYPSLSLLKIGLSRTNPWHRCRTISNRVKKVYGLEALKGLRYVVMSGTYHDEQMIHDRLSPCKVYGHVLTSPTEWYRYQGIAQRWMTRWMQEAASSAIEADEIEVRTKKEA